MRKLIEYFKEYYSDNSGTKRSDSSTMFKSYCRAANEKPETKEWISSINHSGWKEIRHEPWQIHHPRKRTQKVIQRWKSHRPYLQESWWL